MKDVEKDDLEAARLLTALVAMHALIIAGGDNSFSESSITRRAFLVANKMIEESGLADA